MTHQSNNFSAKYLQKSVTPGCRIHRYLVRAVIILVAIFHDRKTGSHNLGVIIIGVFVKQDLLFATQKLNTCSALHISLSRSVSLLLSAF